MKKSGIFILLFLGMLTWSGCSKEDPSINIFSVEDDIALGQQVNAAIAANPQDFPVLDPVQYAAAYAHLNSYPQHHFSLRKSEICQHLPMELQDYQK